MFQKSTLVETRLHRMRRIQRSVLLDDGAQVGLQDLCDGIHCRSVAIGVRPARDMRPLHEIGGQTSFTKNCAQLNWTQQQQEREPAKKQQGQEVGDSSEQANCSS